MSDEIDQNRKNIKIPQVVNHMIILLSGRLTIALQISHAVEIFSRLFVQKNMYSVIEMYKSFKILLNCIYLDAKVIIVYQTLYNIITLQTCMHSIYSHN